MLLVLVTPYSPDSISINVKTSGMVLGIYWSRSEHFSIKENKKVEIALTYGSVHTLCILLLTQYSLMSVTREKELFLFTFQIIMENWETFFQSDQLQCTKLQNYLFYFIQDIYPEQ